MYTFAKIKVHVHQVNCAGDQCILLSLHIAQPICFQNLQYQTFKAFPVVEQTKLSIWISIEEDNFSDDIFPLCYRPVFSLTDVFGTWEVILY